MTDTTEQGKRFIALDYSRINSANQSIMVDEVELDMMGDFKDGNYTTPESFHKSIHALDWFRKTSVLYLPDKSRLAAYTTISNIATVFQAVLKGDGIYQNQITATKSGSVYDEGVLRSFLDKQFKDDKLFSEAQCTDIYKKLSEAKRIVDGKLTPIGGDKMGIVIVIEGPWGVKITITITL